MPQGEFFAFLGPNAAGKTTTIKMLTGLLKPEQRVGDAWQGSTSRSTRPKPSGSSAYVPDFPFLYDKLTPREFLRFVGELYEMDQGRHHHADATRSSSSST